MKKTTLLFLLLSIVLVNCSKDDLPVLSSENKILSFEIEVNNITYKGSINHLSKEIRIKTLGLEGVTSLIPSVKISDKAIISPSTSASQNFNNTINYMVTSESGETANYRIITENTPFSSEKKILTFKINIDGEVFPGNIDHDKLTINVETYKDVLIASPIITISENSIISTNLNDSQDFNEPVEYIVTAQDGTSNVYTVNILKSEINSTIKKCYIRAVSGGRVTHLNLDKQNYDFYLENDTNSYLLNIFDIETGEDNGVSITNFSFRIDDDIETDINYKVRAKVNGEIKAETPYFIDVLKENAPKINTANQKSYSYNDTLVLTGENLVAGVRIPANGSIYQFVDNYVSISLNKTELTLPLTYDYAMFPSWIGRPSPRPTRVSIYHNGRHGDSIILDFN